LWRARASVMGMAKQKPPKQRKFGKGVAKCRRCGTTVRRWLLGGGA
jgi:small subunit ribosomal protein S14